jgi:hypothetical protein
MLVGLRLRVKTATVTKSIPLSPCSESKLIELSSLEA